MLRRSSLSARLTLALSATAVALLGAVGAWQISAEEGDLRRAVERDLRLLGRSLEVAFENALRDRQAEDMVETLRELERIDPAVDIYVYDRFDRPIAASTGAVARPAATSTRERALRFREDADPPSVELTLPLQIAQGEPPATLVLVRPLREMHADLAATRWRVVLSMAAFVLVVAVLTMALSRFWVSAPLARMVSHMRRVRAGDLSPSTQPHGADEVGATLQEFEALVRDLAEARSRLETEGEARRRLELALREVDKLATIGELAAGLAHEIGSPLQVLDGRIGALEAKADDPGETRRVARILREQAQRITRIVARLTGLAQRRPMASRALDAGPPVRTVVDLLEGEARRRGVRLSLEIARDLPALRGDSDSLQQLALNLLRNSLDATEAGGHIEVRMERAFLIGPDERVSPGVRVVVRDTGRGMSEATTARVFEPFFTTRSPEGSGLGLAVVKGIVDDYRGRIEVRSEEGRGTTVTVDLPACEEER